MSTIFEFRPAEHEPTTWEVWRGEERLGLVTRYKTPRGFPALWGYGEPGLQGPTYDSRDEAVQGLLEDPPGERRSPQWEAALRERRLERAWTTAPS